MPNQRSNDQTQTSISMPKELYEAAKERAKAMDLRFSQYLRHLAREDMAKYHASKTQPEQSSNCPASGCSKKQKEDQANSA